VYQSNEQNGAQNLYVDDLTGPRAVISYATGGATFLGHNNVSTDGRTIVWEDASGDLNANYHPQAIWTVPTNGSSAPRQISPALQTNESLNVRSSLSADGKWIVYGVTSAGGVETLYMANLLPGGTSTAIPVPAGALRIESALQAMLFGPTSQYLYFTATTDLGGSVLGQATYRIPVATPGVPTMLSTAAVANRKAVIRLISSDDTNVVQVSVDGAAVPELEHIQTGTPGMNRFRVIDSDTKRASNEVKVQIR
jgi:Tol biopolymer transport system component